MFFHKETRMAFVLVPRTGSTSLRTYLNKIGFKRIVVPGIKPGEDYHTTLEQCAALHPNLNNYKVYGVYRDPVKRFLSGLTFFWQMSVETHSANSNLPDLNVSLHDATSYDELVRRIFNWDVNTQLIGIPKLIFMPQINWLGGNVNVVNYEKMVDQVKHITRLHNMNNINFMRLNNTYLPNNFGTPSDDVVNFAKLMYNEDYSLESKLIK